MDLVLGTFREGVRKVGLLAGGFNPPTLAHLSLLRAAGGVLDAVACVVPRRYPHKDFSGADFDQRIGMLAALGFPVLASDRGLFIDIAREFRRDIAAGAEVELHFLCGRDAAERIVSWDYGDELVGIERQLTEYRLLVAARQGEYEPPSHLRHGVSNLAMEAGYDEVSSTLVRELLIQGNEGWRQHVPQEIHDLVGRIYRRR